MNHFKNGGQEFLALLDAYCATRFSDKENVQVKALTDMSAGWESTLYAFQLVYGSAAERQQQNMVLRLLLGEGAADKAEREFNAIRRLHQAGYPVPEVYAFEAIHSPLGQPFILMERIDGETLWPLMERASPEQRTAYLALFCQLLVQLHKLDWRPFTDSQPLSNPYHFINQWLNQSRGFLRQFPHRQEIEPVFQWLEAHHQEMACLRPSPIHQDFHPANVLVRRDGSAVVIDWTGFAVSDYRFDLAWTLLLAYAYEGATTREQILTGYERISGERVKQLAGFEVVACLRRLIGVYISLVQGPEQMGMRPEAAVTIQAQLPAHQRVAELLTERTGYHLPFLESIWKLAGGE